MVKHMFDDLIEIFDEEYEERMLITPQNTAEKMTAKGYRKQSEVVKEIADCLYDCEIEGIAISVGGKLLTKKEFIEKFTGANDGKHD